MIIIDRRTLKKLESFREYLHLDDNLSDSDFYKAGAKWFLVYLIIEILGRASFWRYGFSTAFFENIWWIPRVMFLIFLSRNFLKTMPHKTISTLAVFSGVWGFFLGISIGIEKVILFRDLANFFLIFAEGLGLFFLGSVMGYIVYRPPLTLLYKHESVKTNEED